MLLESMFDEHNRLLCSYADVVVDIKSEKQNFVKLVLNKIEEYYENR